MSMLGKNITVIAGDGRPRELMVHPNETALEVVQSAGLPEEYKLSRNDGLPYGDDEVVYDGIRNGDKLFASAPITVGKH